MKKYTEEEVLALVVGFGVGMLVAIVVGFGLYFLVL